MDQSEIDSFVMTGRGATTNLANAAELLKKWSQSFETRGGGAVFGEDATQIVYLANDLAEWMTPERAATISRLRLDV